MPSGRVTIRRVTATAHPKDKDEVSALARGLVLVRTVADAEASLSNRELADRTGLPKATVSRLAATLVSAGYLRQDDDTERYTLGPQLLDLGHAYLRRFDFRQQARVHLAALAEFAGANVHMGVRDGLDILMVETAHPRTAIILSRTGIGTRMAIPVSASGRAYLCSADAPEREALLQALRRDAGGRWKSLRPRLADVMAEYAERGFCSSFGEWHPDIHALGFTLRGPRGELYACSCGGPAYKLPRAFLLDQVGPQILATQAAIAQDLGAAATG